MADIERQAANMAWGKPDEVTERIIADAEHAGANTVLVNMNRGAMPHEHVHGPDPPLRHRGAAGAPGAPGRDDPLRLGARS